MRIRVFGHEGTAKLGQTDFLVLAIEYSEGSGLHFRVDEDGEFSGSPFLVPAAKSVVLEGSIPSSWRAKSSGEGSTLEIALPEWLEDGFWEAFYDREPSAVAAFRRRKAAIEAEARGT